MTHDTPTQRGMEIARLLGQPWDPRAARLFVLMILEFWEVGHAPRPMQRYLAPPDGWRAGTWTGLIADAASGIRPLAGGDSILGQFYAFWTGRLPTADLALMVEYRDLMRAYNVRLGGESYDERKSRREAPGRAAGPDRPPQRPPRGGGRDPRPEGGR